MKFTSILSFVAFGLLSTVSAADQPGDPKDEPDFPGGVPWERLDKNNSVSFLFRQKYTATHTFQVLVVLDLQVGLYHTARDWDPTLYRNNIIAHAALGKLFDIPTILSTSAEQGPNGPLPKEILDMYPDAPLIKRNGEVG